MLAVSVVICVYTEKRLEELIAAVKSVKNQTVQPAEIVVVIDHNSQLARLIERRLDGVVLVESQEPRGLSGARNSGIEAACGNVIAFLDDDAVAEPDWLGRLLPHYEDPKVMGVGGRIEPMYVEKPPAWLPDELGWVVGCTYRGLPDEASVVRNLIGCNMSFRREVLEFTGGFRVGVGRVGTLLMGREDDETELCIRASKQLPGRVFIYDPQAKVRHRVPAERANWRYLLQRCHSEGRSKAQLASLVGAGDSLANEWRYTLETLPKGVGRYLLDLFVRRDLGGLGRIFAIVAGFIATASGYMIARVAGVFDQR